jgi:hypothetical protein
MAIGPGKYDFEVTQIREQLQADGIILVVFGGIKGHSFCAQLDARIVLNTPQMLREIADNIEKGEGTKQ